MSFTSANAPSASMVPACINQAINFLTRPLILTQSSTMVEGVQAILRITLSSSFNPAKDASFTLSLSTTQLPPRPIFATCIATGIHWVEWMNLLGKRDFDLFIQPHSVSVTYFGLQPHTVVVWAQPTLSQARRSLLARLNFGEPQVPISKLGQQSALQASLRATADSARVRVKTRTVAQQLLESDNEEEADEIFAMISRTAMLSPSPTHEKFGLSLELPTSIMPISMNSFPSPLSPPEASPSPVSSRPSSRSSTFSDYSFSSDDEESVTSASSVASFDFLASTKRSDNNSITSPIKTFNRHAPAFVPRQQQAAPRVFIDNNKKDVTKYLYQGGVSTVLTGGVMLGGGASATAKPKAEQVPKYRAPIGGKRLAPTQNATSANSWRRGPRV